MRRGAAAAAALLTALALAPAALAACPQTSVADIEDEVMCPVCGTPLGLAREAPQAQRQRAFIQRQVDACRSKDEIKAALEAEFGREVLALPDDDGFGLAAYVVPLALALAAAGGVAIALPRWRAARRAADRAPVHAPADPEDRRRIDAELARLDP